jgi:hypothetical protein
MKRLYTTREAKAELACGTTKLYDEINAGKIDALKHGRRTYITGESIERRIAEMKRLETPTMAKAARGNQNPPAEQSDNGRQSPRSRFGSVAPRTPAAE